ncbi:hypothetical protein ABT299_50635 [Spirillospora sp. NPDC000708]
MPGTVLAAFYDDLATAFGLTIAPVGPHYGLEPLLDAIADSTTLTTFVGDRTRLVWPADHDLRRVPVHDPTPVYPHSLIWHRDNHHPALTALRAHLGSPPAAPGTWTPHWAHRAPSPA